MTTAVLNLLPLLAQVPPGGAATPDRTLLLWAIVCLAIAAMLLVLELFIPSGGIIGIAAGAALIAGIVLLVLYDTHIGLMAAIGALLAVPFFVVAAIRIWPSTPIARLLTLSDHETPATSPASTSDHDSLVGATGHALTDLRPVGVCQIGDRRLDCMADGTVIRAGSPVRVTSVEGMQVRVQLHET